MKHTLYILLICCLLGSCATAKKGSTTPTPQAAPAGTTLHGDWELDLMPSGATPFDSLYPRQKPSLSFDTGHKQLRGYTGCNRMQGPYTADDHTISFNGAIATTRMACPGGGEQAFLEQLKKVNRYAISADNQELTLIRGDVALMRFHRKQP